MVSRYESSACVADIVHCSTSRKILSTGQSPSIDHNWQVSVQEVLVVRRLAYCKEAVLAMPESCDHKNPWILSDLDLPPVSEAIRTLAIAYYSVNLWLHVNILHGNLAPVVYQMRIEDP